MFSADNIEPIKRRKLYEQIADRMERLILTGALGEGDELPSERELMQRFVVGRSAIREAMLSLERSGLVTLSNGRVARVSRPTMTGMLLGLGPAARLLLKDPAGMRDFQAARRTFEVAIAREVARGASDADIRLLREALESNLACSGDAEAFKRTDLAFHDAIVMLVGNPILVALQHALSDWLLQQRSATLDHPGAERHAIEFHTRIFDAIAARDPDAAETAMGTHLDEVARFYWRGIENQGEASELPLPRSSRKETTHG